MPYPTTVPMCVGMLFGSALGGNGSSKCVRAASLSLGQSGMEGRGWLGPNSVVRVLARIG